MSGVCAPSRNGPRGSHPAGFAATLLFVLGAAAGESNGHKTADAAARVAKLRSATGICPELEVPPGSAPWSRVCSLEHPLCVCASPSSPGSEQLEIMDATDRAWDALVAVLGVPAPERGFEGKWNLYLSEQVKGGGRAQLVALDPWTRFERGVSYASIDRSARGCALEIAAARAVAQGSLLAAAPSTPAGLGLAESEQLARLATPCAASEEAMAAFQSEPERTLVDGTSPDFARGAAAFFEWLDATFARSPGALVPALWALTPTSASADSSAHQAGATAFDVLATSLRGALASDSTLDEVFVGFAVARASAWPPVQFAWDLPWPTRARRLVAPTPVSPTGASYIEISHAGAPPGARMRLEMEWEDYARMRWVALKFDGRGAVLAQIHVTSPDRATQAALTLEGLDGIDRVVMVGVNVGSTEHKFSPAQGEWEPHGWLLTIEGLAP